MDKKQQTFCKLKRLLNLLKLDIYCSYRNLLLVLIATTGFGALINFITFNIVGHFNIHSVFYSGFTVLLGGFIFSSLAFTDAHKKGSDLQYMVLPASIFEKFLSKLIISNFIYLLATIPVYFIISTLAEGLSLLFFTKSHPLFNPFTLETLISWFFYFILQSVFLFGSIFFKKMAFAKTASALILTLILFSMFFSAIFLIINADYFLNKGFLVFANLNELLEKSNYFFEIVGQIAEVLFYICFAPFFWFLTYLRLRELEV